MSAFLYHLNIIIASDVQKYKGKEKLTNHKIRYYVFIICLEANLNMSKSFVFSEL